jgi:rubredoxin
MGCGLSGDYQKWQCFYCGYVYDEALGAPQEGIPAGTRWKDVPDSWICPVCGARKSDFAMYEMDPDPDGPDTRR